MFKLFKTVPAEDVGPDGMTDFSRELHKQWARRDAVMDQVYERIAERTGIDSDLVPHLPYEFLTLALLLGARLENNQE